MTATPLTMRRIALADVRPDDVLAEPILDAGGGVLLAAGASLSTAMAERLSDRGVTEAVVLSEPAAPVSQAERDAALAVQREHIKVRIEQLFRHSLKCNEVNPLMHIVWRYRSEPLS